MKFPYAVDGFEHGKNPVPPQGWTMVVRADGTRLFVDEYGKRTELGTVEDVERQLRLEGEPCG